MKHGSISVQRSTSPRKEAMPVEYRSDGTGRDSYIVCNSGGMKQIFNKTCGEQFFKETLRQSERPLFKSQRRGGGRPIHLQKPFEVDITTYRNWITPKQQRHISEMAKQQKILINKLSPIRTGLNQSLNAGTPIHKGQFSFEGI